MNLSFLISTIRKSKGITQEELARKVQKNRSAIAQFEKGHASLSKETLSKIAIDLDINPEYIVGNVSNPFSSDKLIKLFLTGIFPEYFPLYLLVLYNQSLEFISLIPPMNIIEKMRFLPTLRTIGALRNFESFLGKMVYAVCARDVDGNIFIFRRKQINDFVLWGKIDLESFMSSAIANYGKDKSRFSFRVKEIDKELFNKIKDWTVEREDIEPMFSKPISALNEQEKELIVTLRERRIEPTSVLNLINQTT